MFNTISLFSPTFDELTRMGSAFLEKMDVEWVVKRGPGV